MTVTPVSPGETIASGTYGNAVIAALVPTGAVVAFAGSSAPSNWLLCDGATASRTTYADLFNVIGTTYGVGDGSTTFNLPDLRGRCVHGFKSTDTLYDTLGETGGASTHTLALTEVPYHDHGGVTGGQSVTHNHADAGHSHDAGGVGNNDWAIRYAGSSEGLMATHDGDDVTFTNMDNDYADIGDASVDHTHSVGGAGGGTAHSIQNEYLTLQYIIKT